MPIDPVKLDAPRNEFVPVKILLLERIFVGSGPVGGVTLVRAGYESKLIGPELTKCADLTDKGTKIERCGGRGEENQRDAVCLVSCTGLPKANSPLVIP